MQCMLSIYDMLPIIYVTGVRYDRWSSRRTGTGAAEGPDDGEVAGSVNGGTVVSVVGVTVHVTR